MEECYLRVILKSLLLTLSKFIPVDFERLRLLPRRQENILNLLNFSIKYFNTCSKSTINELNIICRPYFVFTVDYEHELWTFNCFTISFAIYASAFNHYLTTAAK